MGRISAFRVFSGFWRTIGPITSSFEHFLQLILFLVPVTFQRNLYKSMNKQNQSAAEFSLQSLLKSVFDPKTTGNLMFQQVIVMWHP
ncbi:hypothetical protein ABVF61_12235 [Roseibium sp. HPY-6]|uniref:hypothetical protein n=1 Tax=Roseibium sp. HPY-6 TaxID=3229852 RepID=UPI00338DD05A